MTATQIDKIQKEFVAEAKNSPVLMSDLANMEKYIAESYDGRSLIELLQNADDAGAENFYVKKINETAFIAANDGRLFTNDDLYSLCRSGASTKKRKADTIGYRGIGFKSVVNYAKRVHLVSGDIKITFSRSETQRLLGGGMNVPLVRIPHQFDGKAFKRHIEQAMKRGYKTIFIFESDCAVIKEEIDSFDHACMLFLKHVNRIILDFNEQKINAVTRKKINGGTLVSIGTNDNNEKWLVFSDSNLETSAIAYRYDQQGKKIIESPNGENRIHCFMPTAENFAIGCRVNGDFSTDPSRTHIILDDDTDKTLKEISHIIVEQIDGVLRSQTDKLHLVELIANITVNPLSRLVPHTVNDRFIEIFKVSLLDLFYSVFKNKKLCVQPDWLMDDDLSMIDTYGYLVIPCSLGSKIGGLYKLLNFADIRTIDMQTILLATLEHELSPTARINVIRWLINQYRFNLPQDKKKLIEHALLFQSGNTIKPLHKIRTVDEIAPDFIAELEKTVGSQSDIRAFLLKFGIQQRNGTETQYESIDSVTTNGTSGKTTYGTRTILEKWRSVELNSARLLEKQSDVVSVEDVSRRNVGYDLEATMTDGVKQFYEVKSVKKLGDEVVLTNNEYLMALQFPEQYKLFVVCQDDEKIEACVIDNPAHTLDMEKRIKSYEWICNSYSGKSIVEKF